MSNQVVAKMKPAEASMQALQLEVGRPPSLSRCVQPLAGGELTKLVQMLNLGNLLDQNLQESELRERCFDRAVSLIKSGEFSALSQAKDIVKKLDHLGRTLLMEFAARGDATAIEGLINNKIALLSKGPDGRTALHEAAACGHAALIGLLSKYSGGASPQDKNEVTPLHLAAVSGFTEVAYELVEAGAVYNALAMWAFSPEQTLSVSPLALAVAFGHAACAELLLGQPDIDLKVPVFGNLLHFAAHFGSFELLEELLKHEKIQALLNEKDAFGRTPFAVACYAGAIEVLEVLHAHNAKIELAGHQDRTAMHWAILGRQVDAIEFLAYHAPTLLNEYSKVDDYPLALAKNLEPKEAEDNLIVVSTLEDLLLKAKRNAISPPNFEKHLPENIVFQGGGPAGIAHVGAYKALVEDGKLQYLRRVAGTSAGAITAAFISVGISPEKVLDLVGKDMKTFLDLTPEATNFLKKIKQPDLEAAVAHYESAIGALFKEAAIGGFKKNWKGILGALFGFGKKGITSAWLGGSKEAMRGFPAGLCAGAQLEEEIEDAISEATGVAHCTFLELRGLVAKEPSKFKHLWVTVTCVSPDGTTEIVRLTSENIQSPFIPKWCETIVISSAVRASSNLPFVFEPCVLKAKLKGSAPAEQPQFGQFLDGGMIANLDIEAFDEERFQTQKGFVEDAGTRHVMNKKTLGFALVNPPKASEEESTRPKFDKSDLLSVAGAFLSVYKGAEQKLRALKPYNRHRIVEIDRLKVKATDFSLSDEQKEQLFTSGQEGVSSFFKKKI